MLDLLLTPKTGLTAAEREAIVRGSYWLPTQKRWIESNRRLKLLVKTRRFGGSWAEAYRVLTRTALEGNKYDAWVGSRDMLAARLFINDVKKWARTINAVTTDLGQVMISDPVKDFAAFQVHVGDHDITSLSSSPDAFAGKEGRFTKDEAALHKELRLWLTIAGPAIMRGGSISLISTQRGRLNYFNELVEEIKFKGNPKKFELFEINIIQAVAEGLWIKIRDALPEDDERKGFTEDEFLQGLRDECPDEEAWKQEFMCIASDDADALITWEEIIGCAMHDVDRAVMNAIPDSAPRYVGMDIGRKKDLTVIWQWALVAGILLEERKIIMSKKKFSEQDEMLYSLIDNPRVLGVRIDASGLGMDLAERAETRHPDKVVGITLSAPEKLRLAVQFKRRFQDKSLRIEDDNATHYDFFSVKKHISSNDNILLRSEAGETDGHADRFWAAALGVDAAENTASVGWMTRLKSAINKITQGGGTRMQERRNRSAE